MVIDLIFTLLKIYTSPKANFWLRPCCGLVVYVAVLLQTCHGEVANLLRGNWCNGFWLFDVEMAALLGSTKPTN